MSKRLRGSWFWEVNPGSKSIDLRSDDGTGTIIMDFARWGMDSVAPRFQQDNLMCRADEFFQVEPGREHHASWHAILNHPDAHKIAAAQDLYKACQAAHDAFMSEDPNAWVAALSIIQYALNRAEGKDGD